MAQTATSRNGHVWTAQELFERFGPIPLDRIRTDPPPGLATMEDAVAINEAKKGHCEYVDGILLEKTVGAYESYLAVEIAHFLRLFLDEHDLGLVLITDGSYRFVSGRMRMPDVSFISWERMGEYDLQTHAVVPFAPDLAVEVISPNNTKKEMEDKLDDYFGDDVRLVWCVYPTPREIHVYQSRDNHEVIPQTGQLTGGDVLPGFELPLKRLFRKPGAK